MTSSGPRRRYSFITGCNTTPPVLHMVAMPRASAPRRILSAAAAVAQISSRAAILGLVLSLHKDDDQV